MKLPFTYLEKISLPGDFQSFFDVEFVCDCAHIKKGEKFSIVLFDWDEGRMRVFDERIEPEDYPPINFQLSFE